MGSFLVPTLFDLTADAVSTHLNLLERHSFADLPVTILTSLVDFLSAQHLEELDDIFKRNGIDTSRAWREHTLKRWAQTYHFRPPIFKTRHQSDSKQVYFQKHFHESLRALLHYSSYDPSTPLRQKLRDDRFFEARPMNRTLLKQDVDHYAGYAQTLVTSSAKCDNIHALTNAMKALKQSTKVLEVYLHACVYRSAITTGHFVKFLRELKNEGSLEELHLHVSNFDIREIFIEIVRECSGQNNTDAYIGFGSTSDFKKNISSILGINSKNETKSDLRSTEDDLFDEALSTLSSRKTEKEFQRLLALSEKKSDPLLRDSSPHPDVSYDIVTSKAEEGPKERQLKGLAVYDLHCCGETARDLAYLLIGWNQLEKLAIHYFGGARSNAGVGEENDPDLALLSQVILHKLRWHQLTHLILLEHAVEQGSLTAVVRFYTSVIAILNTEYRLTANPVRPLQFLRLPVVCTAEDTQLYSGKTINNSVRAIEHLKVDVDPPYPQNREMAARHLAPFLTGFIRNDSALVGLTIQDSAAYMFRGSDQDIQCICAAIAEAGRIEELELDFNISTSVAVEAVVDMIGQNQSLCKLNLMRIGLDWEEAKVKVVQKKLIDAVKNHQSLTHLTLKGRLGRALNGDFLVGFLVSVLHGAYAPKLKQLDISETGICSDDLFKVVSALKTSPCLIRSPVLETLRVRSTVKCPDTTLDMLAKLKNKLKQIAFIVELSFEERFGFQAELLAQV